MPTTPRPAALPADANRIADLLLAPGTDQNAVQDQLITQEGREAAFPLLAEAHHVASDRLFADAA